MIFRQVRLGPVSFLHDRLKTGSHSSAEQKERRPKPKSLIDFPIPYPSGSLPKTTVCLILAWVSILRFYL